MTAILFTLLLTGCKEKEYGFDVAVKQPDKIVLKKGSSKDFYLKLENTGDKTLKIDKITTSCQCLILSDNHIEIEPKSVDSIKVKLHGSFDGENSEAIIMVNNQLKRFKSTKINYQVVL